ncbi:MAG TPA: DMT family transporter [Nitrososphaerales archaeon]|nr:DMT family transporter [Nitrososphaerales archaeon]
MPDKRSYVLLVILSIIWGLAFVAIRRADFELTPVNLTLLRWFIVSAAFLVLYPFVVKPRASFNRKDLPRLAVVGLTNVVVYHIALNTAEVSVPASLAGLLISFGPIFLVLLSMAILHEAVGGRIWLALAIAVFGAAAISSPGLSLGTSGLVGPVLVVVAGLSNAVYTVASKPLVLKYGPIPVSAWASLVGTLMLVPLASQSLVAQAEGLSSVGWESNLSGAAQHGPYEHDLLHPGSRPGGLQAGDPALSCPVGERGGWSSDPGRRNRPGNCSRGCASPSGRGAGDKQPPLVSNLFVATKTGAPKTWTRTPT